MRTIFYVLIFLFSSTQFYGQIENSKTLTRSIYSNWMSADYLRCLKTDLPCECEKSKEYFLISLDTTRKFVLLYDGRTNYDYNLYHFRTISQTNLEVYNRQYSQTLFKDTIIVIGQIKIQNDTLFFTEASGKQLKFILYSKGDNDSYLKEHIKLLDLALIERGYDNLNQILHSESLKCWCNWELEGGINIIYGTEKNWILKKKENQLHIYEWTNPPTEKKIT